MVFHYPQSSVLTIIPMHDSVVSTTDDDSVKSRWDSAPMCVNMLWPNNDSIIGARIAGVS